MGSNTEMKLHPTSNLTKLHCTVRVLSLGILSDFGIAWLETRGDVLYA